MTHLGLDWVSEQRTCGRKDWFWQKMRLFVFEVGVAKF